LKTVADDFPPVVYPERYAISTLGRGNPSDLIANLRECCRSNTNRVNPHEEKDPLELKHCLAKTKNRRRVSFGTGCEIQLDLQKPPFRCMDFHPLIGRKGHAIASCKMHLHALGRRNAE